MGLRALAVPALALAIAGSAAAQESVRSARVIADLTAGDGSAVVRIEYVLSGARGDGSVAARALDFGGAAVSRVRAGAAGSELAVTRGPGLSRAVALPRGIGEELIVSYEVARAFTERPGGVRGHVPVLGLERPLEGSRPGLFSAELRVPPGWRILEGFPTGLAPTGEPGVYRAELAVVPAVVSFRARPDGTWRPGLHHLLDALAVSLLVGFGVLGWRHLGRRDA